MFARTLTASAAMPDSVRLGVLACLIACANSMADLAYSGISRDRPSSYQPRSPQP